MAAARPVTLFTELREFPLLTRSRSASRRKRARWKPSSTMQPEPALPPERQTGGVSRDIERGPRRSTLLNYTIFNIPPTLVEMALVISLLSAKFDGWFAAITFRRAGALHRLHGERHRVAHAFPPQ